MARDVEQLVLTLSADIKRFEKAMTRQADVADRELKRTEKRVAAANKSVAELGASLGPLALGAGVAFGALSAYTIKAASDADETANAFRVAFGSLTADAEKFARAYSKSVGRALDETQGNMARTQLVLTGVGVSAEQALKITQSIQARAVDLGSLWNVDDAEAFASIMSGISGEAEPMKKFGVALNEAALKAELLKRGFKGNAQDAPEAAKAIARYNIILAATKAAEGDAIRTKDGLANSVKRARAEFRDAAVEMGQQFLPTAAKVTSATADMFGEFNKLPEGVQIAGLALLALVAASGPMAAVISGFGRVIKAAQAARAAIALVGGGGAAAGAAGAAAGAAGGAAAAGGLTATAVGAAMIAPVVALGGAAMIEARRRDVIKRAQADISSVSEDELRGVVKAMSHGWKVSANSKADTALANTFLAEILKRGTSSAGKADDPTAALLAGLGEGFDLPPNLRTPVGGDGKGKGKKGPSAASLANTARDQEDRTQDAIEAAQERRLRAIEDAAAGDEATAEVVTRRSEQELARLDREQAAFERNLKRDVQDGRLTEAQAQRVVTETRAATEAEKALELSRRNRTLADQEASIRADRVEVEDALRDAAQYALDQARAAQDLERDSARLDALRRGDTRAVEQIDRDQAIADKTRVYEGRGYDPAEARRRAEIDVNNEIAIDLNARIKSGLLDAFEAAKEGGAKGLVEYLGDRLKRKLIDSLADGLSAVIGQLGRGGGGSSGGGNLLSALMGGFGGLFGGRSIANSFNAIDWGGARAAGGPTQNGKLYLTGERGPEIGVHGAGQIVSNARLQQALGGSGRQPGGVVVNFNPTFDARGAGPREVDLLKAEMRRMQAELPGRVVATVADARKRRLI